MTTDFFKNIASLNLPGTWKLVITTDARGNCTVSELFNATCSDAAVKLIVPLTLSGTARDLDEGFFSKITEPAVRAAQLQTNLEAHLKSLEEAEAASKMQQNRKNKEKAQASLNDKKTEEAELPEPKISKEDKKRAYGEAMAKVGELTRKRKFREALREGIKIS